MVSGCPLNPRTQPHSRAASEHPDIERCRPTSFTKRYFSKVHICTIIYFCLKNYIYLVTEVGQSMKFTDDAYLTKVCSFVTFRVIAGNGFFS